jgi:hypothetical protein
MCKNSEIFIILLLVFFIESLKVFLAWYLLQEKDEMFYLLSIYCVFNLMACNVESSDHSRK